MSYTEAVAKMARRYDIPFDKLKNALTKQILDAMEAEGLKSGMLRDDI